MRQRKQTQVEAQSGCRTIKNVNSSRKQRGHCPYDSSVTSTTSNSHATIENYISELDSLKREERKLQFEKKQLLDTLNQLLCKFDIINDRKSRLLTSMEKSLLSRQQSRKHDSGHTLFSVVTWGPSWTDVLVFNVMAENEVWAEELVRQWLVSNGRENHKIDRVMALVSQDVRAIVNVGAKLLDV
jgi:hypothetical protein